MHVTGMTPTYIGQKRKSGPNVRRSSDPWKYNYCGCSFQSLLTATDSLEQHIEKKSETPMDFLT